MKDATAKLEKLFDRLWPICRSITGEGYRTSLDILSEIMPTRRLRYESGRKVLDWFVPDEWNVRDAYFVDPQGQRHAEFKKNNLHLVNYSIPFCGKICLAELKSHLHTLPAQPRAIPYVTSYYKSRWGFCLSQEEFEQLPEGEYDVVVDTELKPGWMEVGEAVLEGRSEGEVLFSTYLCHPSMANNELSGPLTMMFLYERIAAMSHRRLTYRFVVCPETIGAICYLSERGTHLKACLIAGYQLTCIGDRGPFTYKRSRRGDTPADHAATLGLRDIGTHRIIPFTPYEGSDERQYCSPGFNLPVGSLMRTPYLQYPEYHTSLDNKDFICFDSLAQSVDICVALAEALEENRFYQNTVMYGEPQLGRRGLYDSIRKMKSTDERDRAIFWLLNMADGTRDMFSIAELSGVPLSRLLGAAKELVDAGLLRERGV